MNRLYIIIPLLLIATTLLGQIDKNKLVIPPKRTIPGVSTVDKKVVIKDINGIAKDLIQAKTSADNAAVRLKSVNGSTPQTCYSAMVAAGYNDLETGKAVSKVYNMDIRQTLMDLPTKETALGTANILNPRLRIVKYTFPNLTFEQIVDNIRNLSLRHDNLFTELCKVFGLNNQQIIQKGVFYYNQQFLDNVTNAGEFYPNSNHIYSFIKNISPNINHFELFVMLINGGYAPSSVYNENPAFIATQNGRTSDVASSCLKNIMPTGLSLDRWFRTKMVLVLNSDGSSSVPVQKDCYVELIKILKGYGLSSTNAGLLLQSYMECSPLNNTSCEAAKVGLINTILTEAGYQEDRRR